MTPLLQFLGTLFIATALMVSPRILRIDPVAMVKCSLFLTLFCVLKTILFVSIKFIPPGMKEFISTAQLSDLFYVFLEDALYTLPILILARYNNSWTSALKYIFWPVSVIAFASGHLYQGIQGFIVSLFYIPLTYKLAKHYGLGTVMVLHVLWDVLMYIVSLLLLGVLLQ